MIRKSCDTCGNCQRIINSTPLSHVRIDDEFICMLHRFETRADHCCPDWVGWPACSDDFEEACDDAMRHVLCGGDGE